MIDDAIAASSGSLNAAVTTALKDHWLAWFQAMRNYEQEIESCSTFFQRRLYQATQLAKGSTASRRYLLSRICGKPEWLEVAPKEIQSRLETLGLGPILIAE
jgi:hypothetical protein